MKQSEEQIICIEVVGRFQKVFLICTKGEKVITCRQKWKTNNIDIEILPQNNSAKIIWNGLLFENKSEQVAFQSNENHPLAESMGYIKFEGM